METNTASLILLVEDERELAEIFQRFFEREGYRVLIAGDGVSALEMHRRFGPDLVVLDVRLPKRDGLDVLSEIRRSSRTPVIMSTALGEDLEKLMALKLGADDYIVKPFNPLELVARTKAVLRRVSAALDQDDVIRAGCLSIDLLAHQVLATGEGLPDQQVPLTPTEFRILAHLGRNTRRAFTRSEIVDACLASDHEALDRTVDSHMSNIRSKLARFGAADMLQGVRGIGYRLAGS